MPFIDFCHPALDSKIGREHGWPEKQSGLVEGLSLLLTAVSSWVTWTTRLFFGRVTWGMWDLSFLTRDWTCASCIGSMESWPLDHLQSPCLRLNKHWTTCRVPAWDLTNLSFFISKWGLTNSHGGNASYYEGENTGSGSDTPGFKS